MKSHNRGCLPTGALQSSSNSPTATSDTSTPEPFGVSSTIIHGTIHDIEHVPVENDPRAWSTVRKNASLTLIASAAMIAGLAGSIQNPAVKEMEDDLPATSSQFSLSISMFILIQGLVPSVWSAVSEVKGRKVVYIISLSLFTLSTIVVALSRNINLVIGFRCLQAAGSSAVMSIGAATLADIFEPEVRGTKMGIFYIAPLLGPAIGPIFGGVLTSAWNWRAIFWFLAIVSGSILLAFALFFHDTFRFERSLTYQSLLSQRLRQRARPSSSSPVSVESGSRSDLEKTEETCSELDETVKLSIMDVNPFKPAIKVLQRKNNNVILFASGLLFAFAFLVPYTSARLLAIFYHYSPLRIGLVTLCYGAGNVAGSLLGGRWSDRSLTRLMTENGEARNPEMRLRSTILGVCLLPPCSTALGWVCKEHLHVSTICTFLFFCGFFNVWIYTSTLAYIVDANSGRSSTAAAANSGFRGIFAFIATELAVPVQDGLGDGWTYTILGGLMALSGSLVLLVWCKGAQWRQAAEEREAASQK